MRLLPTAAATAAAGLAYARLEAVRFRTAELSVPGPGRERVTLLHLSDTHLTARRKRLKDWLVALPDRLGETPDLVVFTGDLIDDDSGIGSIIEALAGLEARLGRFYVLGSHDYYQARFRPGVYLKYLRGRGVEPKAVPADTTTLEAGLKSKGWVCLTNTSTVVEAPLGTIRLCGVDDPYLHRARTEHISRSRDDALAIGVMHTPDLVAEFALAGFDLILAGHTHGGQVRVPVYGALVTNCSLPPGLASGLHRIDGSWLHVSPGLGTSTYAPIRFNCPPEATLLSVGYPRPL